LFLNGQRKKVLFKTVIVFVGRVSHERRELPTIIRGAKSKACIRDRVRGQEKIRVRGERVTRKAELSEAFNRMLANPGEPYLLDVIVEAEENVFPMIPAGGSYKDIIMSAEDMAARATDT